MKDPIWKNFKKSVYENRYLIIIIRDLQVGTTLQEGRIKNLSKVF